MEHKRPTVYTTVNWIINDLNEKRTTSSGKASLATLRNSAGRPLNASAQVWPIILDKIPVEFLGTGVGPTSEEMSILMTLQLFALHQQGKNDTVILKSQEGKWRNIGFSFSALRTSEDQVAMDRRFNALITSSSFEELTHHLRQLIKLLKSKTKATVDYAKLAEDLFWFLNGYQEGVRLNWARGYYGTKIKGESENE